MQIIHFMNIQNIHWKQIFIFLTILNVHSKEYSFFLKPRIFIKKMINLFWNFEYSFKQKIHFLKEAVSPRANRQWWRWGLIWAMQKTNLTKLHRDTNKDTSLKGNWDTKTKKNKTTCDLLIWDIVEVPGIIESLKIMYLHFYQGGSATFLIHFLFCNFMANKIHG